MCAAACMALALPAVAEAAKKTVFMGVPPAAQRSFEKVSSDVNAYFPSVISVRAGDTVAFAVVGFHTLDIPAKGAKPLSGVAPTGQKVTGVNDAAGMPFWFNGKPITSIDPRLFKSNFGKTVVNGPKGVLSGLPLADRPKPLTVRFPKAGVFKYYCDIHPGMKGTVRVVGKTHSVASPKADAKRVAAQVSSALKVAKGLKAATKPPANTVSLGAEGAGGVTLFAFVPSKLTVPVGTTVRFTMDTISTEVHTASTGPGDPLKEPNSYLGRLVAGFQGPKGDPRVDFPSDPSPGIAALTPALHGNGFWNSGILDSISTTPLPRSNSVTFAAAGTYNMYCLVHPFMHGTIIAQ